MTAGVLLSKTVMDRGSIRWFAIAALGPVIIAIYFRMKEIARRKEEKLAMVQAVLNTQKSFVDHATTIEVETK